MLFTCLEFQPTSERSRFYPEKKMFCVFNTMGAARMTPTLAVNPREWKLIVCFLGLTSYLNGTEGQPTDVKPRP